MAQLTRKTKRATWTAAAMILGGANCAHSCGPSFASVSDSPPFKATCIDMAEGKSCPTLNDTTCEQRVGNQPNPACNTIWKCDVGTEIWKGRPPIRANCASHCPALTAIARSRTASSFDAMRVTNGCSKTRAPP